MSRKERKCTNAKFDPIEHNFFACGATNPIGEYDSESMYCPSVCKKCLEEIRETEERLKWSTGVLIPF